jgi:ArsR family transcriptional regulator
VDAATVFRALGDETRLCILGLLPQKRLCVCQIAQALGISQPNASKHLSRLRSAGIIGCKKISQWCFYTVSETFKQNYSALWTFLRGVFAADPKYAANLKKLQAVIDSCVCCQQILAERCDSQT